MEIRLDGSKAIVDIDVKVTPGQLGQIFDIANGGSGFFGVDVDEELPELRLRVIGEDGTEYGTWTQDIRPGLSYAKKDD